MLAVAIAVTLSAQNQNPAQAGQPPAGVPPAAANPNQRRGPSPEAIAVAGTRSAPSKAEYERWKTELSNWGRWGKEDQLGAVNLITPAKRKQAASLVKDGISVSLAGDVNTERSIDNVQPYEHVMTSAGPTGAGDRLAVSFHGYAHTHIDGFAHRFFDGKMWNGFSHEEVTEADGAKKNSIYNLHNGIVTRGVLIDIPRLKGVAYLEPGTRIFPEDIEAWEKQAGVKVSAGDAVFIRTGRWARRAKTGPWNAAIENAGLDPSVIPWLKRRDVAILGGEGGPGCRAAAHRVRAWRARAARLRADHARHPPDGRHQPRSARPDSRLPQALGVPADGRPAAGYQRHRLAHQSDRRVLTAFHEGPYMSRLQRAGGLVAALFFLATGASAQTLPTSIAGVVKDSSGGVMPGVTVEASSDVADREESGRR